MFGGLLFVSNMTGVCKTMQTMCDILLMQNPLPILICQFTVLVCVAAQISARK
jgi:hypothetical protein